MRGYRAKQNEDGTWNVLDVPIMADFESGHRKLKRVDRAWMEAAIERCSARFRQDGYLPACHVNHHGDPGRPTSRVGHFSLTRASREMFEGQPRWVLFANLTRIPEATYQRIKSGELPYRSVEVHEPGGPPEVDSLALLEDEAPFFKFGVLTIDEESPNTETSPTLLSGSHAPAVAVCRAGSAIRALFRLQEETMEPDETGGGATLDDVMKALAALASMIQGKGAEAEEHLGDESPVDESEKMMDDDKPKDETEEMACVGEGAGGSAKGDMLSALQSLRSDFAKLSASNAAQSERLDARDRTDTVSSRIDKAHEDLKGWPVSDKAKSAIATFAAQGQPVLDSFIEQFKQDVPQDPPKDFETFVGGLDAEDPEEVSAFSGKGADELHLARKANATFEGLKAGSAGFRLSRKAFLGLEVERLKRNGKESEVAR